MGANELHRYPSHGAAGHWSFLLKQVTLLTAVPVCLVIRRNHDTAAVPGITRGSGSAQYNSLFVVP